MGDETGKDAFAGELVRLIRNSTMAVLQTVFRGGFRSLLVGLGHGLAGLAAGLAGGLLVAWVHGRAGALLSSAEPEGVGSAVFTYCALAGAVAGLALGWWYGLRSGFRRALTESPVLEGLVAAVTAQVFGFLERNGISGDRRRELLAEVQEAINRKRERIRDDVDRSLRRVPLLGTLAAGLSGRVYEMIMRTPETMFLQIDLSAGEVDPERRVRESVLSGLRTTLGGAVDSVFARPILVSSSLAVALLALPFATLLL
jgi:hypothetical protein